MYVIQYSAHYFTIFFTYPIVSNLVFHALFSQANIGSINVLKAPQKPVNVTMTTMFC